MVNSLSALEILSMSSTQTTIPKSLTVILSMRPWAVSLGSKLVQMETSTLPHRAVNSKRFHAPMAHCKPVLQRLERMALPSSKSPIRVFSLPTTTVRCTHTTKSPQVGGCWFHPQPQLHGLTSVKCTTYTSKAMSFTSEPTTVFIALTSIQTSKSTTFSGSKRAAQRHHHSN